MKKIDGAAIAATARALYGRELSTAQSATIGEIIGQLSKTATMTAKLQPMEAEPALFAFSFEAETKDPRS